MPRSKRHFDRGPMIHIRLDKDTHRQLKVIVAKSGLTMQHLVSELVRKEVAKAQK